MKISRKARREAKRLYGACLVEGRLNEDRVRTAVRETTEKKPRNYLPVLLHFQRLVRLALRRHQATVDSAAPLAPALQTGIQANLTRLYGPGLGFVFSQKPELIGGLRVQVGSDVYDGSVRSRLDALKDRF
jgi:F-type H+-transporting ATPase subunit delta